MLHTHRVSWSAHFSHNPNSLPGELFLEVEVLKVEDKSDSLNMPAFLEDKRWLFSTLKQAAGLSDSSHI